ncbi:hypothetical protein MMC10_006522 [Thelotrema lepadinum]|nr:hypothetical protein [Thelotrema lepadinum]
MSQILLQDTFIQEVHRLRSVYSKQRDSTNLVPPSGRPVLDLSTDVVDGNVYHTYWFECDDRAQEGQDNYQAIRIADIPGTLSGAILRLKRNLPPLDAEVDYEIIGDKICQLAQSLPLPDIDDDDAEDVSQVLASLPRVAVDPKKHFVKQPKYTSEIQNLLLCQGGSCPGVPKSAHVVQLLGKSADGKLVFEKFNSRYVLAVMRPISVYKAWILQLIDGLRCLHALGIVHRDLRIDNLLFTSDNSRLLICDLESRWGNRLAPEISLDPILDAGWTEKSDVYDLGYVIKGLIYGNAPITNLVEWDVPPPLNVVVESCVRVSADERPSLDELRAMVDQIEV